MEADYPTKRRAWTNREQVRKSDILFVIEYQEAA